MHISPMDLYVKKHPNCEIHYWISWLLFGIHFFKFLLYSKLSFAQQNSLWMTFTTVTLNVTVKFCILLIPLMFFNASWIISDWNCKKWLTGVATGKDLLSHFNVVCSSSLPQLIRGSNWQLWDWFRCTTRSWRTYEF